MKKVIAWLLVLALTAAVSIGATLAYLTDTDEDVNVMTLGKVKIDQLEYERVDVESKDDKAEVQEFHDNKPLLPAVTDKNFNYTPGTSYVDWEQIGKDGYTSDIWDPELINNEVDKMVFVKNKGDYDAYVRSVFAFEASNYTTLDQFKKMIHLNLNETDYTWEWIETPVTIGGSTYFVATATYNKVLAPGALTEISLSQIALDKTATNADVEAFGDTYHVLVKTQAIQADGFAEPAMALNEGFGEITATAIPFDTDQPIQGIDIRNALRFYQGDATQPIHTKVTNVVFGLNKDWSEIVNNHEGTLVTEEQDVPVYAYYIPKGDNYDIYFLANSDIYLPKDSGKLMQYMTNLTYVDTSNLNTSRAELMNHIFRGCSNLKEIDVSNFDFSSATTVKSLFNECEALTELNVANWKFPCAVDMSFMFRNCKGLTSLDVANWDISNAENISNMFVLCSGLTSLDVADWDTSNVVNMEFMFQGARSLTELDLSGWDTGNVTTFRGMFSSYDSNNPDMQLKTVKLENWDTSNVTTFRLMFYGCGQLEKLDLSNWDVSNVTSTYHMFADCNSLRSVNFTGWNTPNLTNMDGMFNQCEALETVDLSDLDTANVEDMSQLFEYCYSLKEVKGLEKWDTSNVWDFKSMFFCCKSLEVVDLSGFETSSAEQVWRMFRDCTALRTVYVGDGWDMSNVDHRSTSYYTDMFTGCSNLVGGNGSTLEKLGATDDTYACVDTEETPGYLTHINDKPANP